MDPFLILDGMSMQEIYSQKRCTIVTSIHKENEVLKVLSEADRDLIIAGDTKSPPSYNLKCAYLHMIDQVRLFPEFEALLPICHYSRKNIGYLYAIKNGYNFIYDTDDDNIPLFKDDQIFSFNRLLKSDDQLLNIYSFFSLDEIWSRGFPPSQTKRHIGNYDYVDGQTASIVYGLCDGDTDVDAIFRLTHSGFRIKFAGPPMLIDNSNLIVFNSQSTFWVDPEVFICLYLPTTVTSRFSDILRSYVTQFVLKSKNKNIGVYPNIAFQDRNEHNIFDDLQEELFMYRKLESLPNILSTAPVSNDISEYFYNLYVALYENAIVDINELVPVQCWIKHITNNS